VVAPPGGSGGVSVALRGRCESHALYYDSPRRERTHETNPPCCSRLRRSRRKPTGSVHPQSLLKKIRSRARWCAPKARTHPTAEEAACSTALRPVVLSPGHAHPKIAEAVAKQVRELDYSPAFQMGHPKIFSLAERVVGLAPAGMGHVFFGNWARGGDTAQDRVGYHRREVRPRDAPDRPPSCGYHGVAWGGLFGRRIALTARCPRRSRAGRRSLPHTPERRRDGVPARPAEMGGAWPRSSSDCFAARRLDHRPP